MNSDDVKSCVACYTSKNHAPKRFSKVKQIILEGLTEAQKQAGYIHPGNENIPRDTRVFHDFTWKDIFLSDTKLSPDAKDDSRRRTVLPIFNDILSAGLVGTDENALIWLAEKTGKRSRLPNLVRSLSGCIRRERYPILDTSRSRSHPKPLPHDRRSHDPCRYYNAPQPHGLITAKYHLHYIFSEP